MALQTSGAISLANIQSEFGGSNPISLSEYYDAASGIPASGAIDFADFYGKSANNDIILDNIASGGLVQQTKTVAKVSSSNTYINFQTGPALDLLRRMYSSAANAPALRWTSLCIRPVGSPAAGQIQVSFQFPQSTWSDGLISSDIHTTLNPDFLGLKVEIGYTSSMEIATRNYTTPVSALLNYDTLNVNFNTVATADTVYYPWNHVDPNFTTFPTGRYTRWTFLFA